MVRTPAPRATRADFRPARGADRVARMVTLYHHPNCSTCKKARSWLSAQGVEPVLIDLREQAPPADVLAEVLRRAELPVAKLFNTSGQVYRNDGWKERRAAMSEAEQLAALADDGLLVKRPIVLTDTGAAVGFREPTWAALFDDA